MNALGESLMQIATWANSEWAFGVTYFWMIIVLCSIQAGVMAGSARKNYQLRDATWWPRTQLRMLVAVNVIIVIAIIAWFLVIGSLIFFFLRS